MPIVFLKKPEVYDFLAENNSNKALKISNDLLHTGATGTNADADPYSFSVARSNFTSFLLILLYTTLNFEYFYLIFESCE